MTPLRNCYVHVNPKTEQALEPRRVTHYLLNCSLSYYTIHTKWEALGVG